jgi:hypothetical protein
MSTVEAVVELQTSTRPGRECTVVWVGGELDRDTKPMLEDLLYDTVGAAEDDMLAVPRSLHR